MWLVKSTIIVVKYDTCHALTWILKFVRKYFETLYR